MTGWLIFSHLLGLSASQGGRAAFRAANLGSRIPGAFLLRIAKYSGDYVRSAGRTCPERSEGMPTPQRARRPRYENSAALRSIRASGNSRIIAIPLERRQDTGRRCAHLSSATPATHQVAGSSPPARRIEAAAAS